METNAFYSHSVQMGMYLHLLLEPPPQIIQYNSHLPNIRPHQFGVHSWPHLPNIRPPQFGVHNWSHLPNQPPPPQFEQTIRQVDKNILGKSGENNRSLSVSVSCFSVITLNGEIAGSNPAWNIHSGGAMVNAPTRKFQSDDRKSETDKLKICCFFTMH